MRDPARLDRWRRAGATDDELALIAAWAPFHPDPAAWGARIDGMGDAMLAEELNAHREGGLFAQDAPAAEDDGPDASGPPEGGRGRKRGRSGEAGAGPETAEDDDGGSADSEG